MLLSTVDVIFADVAQPDQARIISLNAEYFLKNGGFVVISIKASCIDSTASPTDVFAQEVEKLKAGKMKPIEQVTLEPYERDHAMVTGGLLLRFVRTRVLKQLHSEIPTIRTERVVISSCLDVLSLLSLLSGFCFSVHRLYSVAARELYCYHRARTKIPAIEFAQCCAGHVRMLRWQYGMQI